MIKKVFANSSTFLNWLVQSSVDPQSVALTVSGFFSLAVVQAAFNLLPVIGIHPTFTLAVLGQGVSSAVYSLLMIVSYAITFWGLLRKAIVTIHNLVPAPVSKVTVSTAVKAFGPANSTLTPASPVAVPTPPAQQ